MKKYLFRGYDCVGNKGWVYGDLVHNQKVTKQGLEPRVMVGGYEVDPESVGLDSGLKDLNHKDIFEGDILSVKYNGKHLFNATVLWHKKYAGFLMDEGDEDCYSPIPYETEIEVIGSVYENNLKK